MIKLKVLNVVDASIILDNSRKPSNTGSICFKDEDTPSMLAGMLFARCVWKFDRKPGKVRRQNRE